VPEKWEGRAKDVVRGFDVKAFAEWKPWFRLRRLLASGHGAYGLAGPRGAGKTWLMRRAQEYAVEEEGIGLWFPSPSEYDSAAFLAALSERFAEAIEERRQTRYPIIGFATLGAGFSAFASLFFGAVGAFYGVLLFETASATVLGAIIGVTVGLLYLALLRVIRASSSAGRLLLYARDLRQRVRFALTRREGLDLGASLGTSLTGKLGVSREMELAERPLTLSSLVHDFRRLAELAGKAVEGPVVIAIDELDKIDDEQEVRTLLRDIKGIFGVAGVHFLVSVSYEAAKALNLNGIVDRNEFNSSFDVVLEVEPVSVDSLAELLNSRGWADLDPDFTNAVAVLSGGIPRETVRLAELVIAQCERTGRDLGDMDHAGLVAALVAPEALELRRLIVTAAAVEGRHISQHARTGSFEALSEDLLSARGLAERGESFVREFWEPKWMEDALWVERYLEEWRRLLVRLHVASVLLKRRAVRPVDLQSVVYVSSQSATVAILMLLELPGMRGSPKDFVS
jgi:hypothetical protein